MDKMNTNTFINKAKQNKNDEFYTQYEDIEKELSNYPVEQFENKTVLCPCDDYEWSNFTKYFIDNFERLKLKKLICTCISLDKPSVFQIINGDYEENQLKGKYLIKNKSVAIKGYLNSDGDFRNKEILKYKEEADIIITNPPFSLFREFFKWIIDKKFLVIGHQIAITYKDVFLSIKNNEVVINGFKGGYTHFINRHYEDYATSGDHKDGMIRVSGVVWFTNMKSSKEREPLKLKTMKENGIEYQKYDDYDAIEVPYVENIPSDYTGIMGVPITFLYKYNSEQFEIVGEANHGTDNEFDLIKPTLNKKEIFKRILIKKI